MLFYSKRKLDEKWKKICNLYDDNKRYIIFKMFNL